MANELFCPTHGPYDASYSECPFCSGAYKRPAPPASLNEDDQPTDLGYGGPPAGGPDIGSEAPTELPPGSQRGRGFLDIDEDVITDIVQPAGDKTELYPESERTGTLGILWVMNGQRRGKIYPIHDETVIGRKSGELVDLILDDPRVSNPHAKFKVEDEQYVVWDFGSKNGTFVNDEQIREATLLKENDTIKMGDTTFVLKILFQ